MRPRLLAALDAGNDGRLTLVTGPPGSGKTVLLTTWLALRDPRTTLISLGPADRTISGLWGTLVRALRGSRQRATRPAPTTPEMLVERLLELTAPNGSGSPQTLILDDLHLADSPTTRAALSALLRIESAPRLVISSRIDPGLALQRLRLAGSLTEIRGPDLAFTPDEARAVLAEDGIGLSPSMLHRLWTRTEGWAAGLRLAALSLVGHEDPDAFVEDFAGDDRAVVAYLIEEVLERQSEQARELLLATAVVDQVSAPLANALTGRSDAVTILDDLLHANVFLVPLDRRGEWFRYHALFADLLRSQLARRGPAVVARQHRRAAHWFVEQDRPLDALSHSVSAEDWDGATAILADRWLELRDTDAGATLDRVLAAFPPGAIDARPEAALVAAVRCLDRGEPGPVDAHLLAAGRLRHRLSGSRRADFTRGLSLVRLLRAGRDGDVDGAVRELSVVATFAHQDSPRSREAVALAHLEVGRLEAADGAEGAERRLRLAEQLAAGSARPELALEAHAQRAWLYALDGELRAARLAADAALTHAGLLAPPTPGLLAGALVAAEAGDLRHAAEQVRAARAVSPGGVVEPGRLRRLEIAFLDGCLAQAGGRAEAEAACEQLRGALAGWTPPRRLGDGAYAVTAELLVALGRADDALAELPDLPDPRGGGAVSVARVAVLLALDRSEQALTDGERTMACERLPLPVAVAAAARTAAAAEAEGDRGLAQRYAEHALDLAEPEGVRLPLAAAMVELDPVLRRLLRFGTSHRSLIGEVMELARSGTAPSAADVAPLDDALSDRELAVLRYLPTLLSSTEIAGELFVSVNTIKSHLKGVYRKLGVGNRREAVERARDLGLIAVSGLSVERRSPASSPPAQSAG
jgi:LuxR family maltose regulon positive regulatory protein